MPHQPKVSVVILNYNGKVFLEKFLPSVLSSSYPSLEVVVADNASTDDSVPFLKERYPQIRLLLHKENLGFAGGYNAALGTLEADYFVLLNSDVEVSKGWIEPVVDLMESDQRIGACQPKMLSWNDRTHFEYAGASGGWIDALGYPFARGRVFDVCEKDEGQYDNAGPCFWASGAALFVRSEVYKNCGGLDAYFFAHQEEIDLCWRIHLAGYKVYVQPASVVYHVGGSTLPPSARKVFLNFRNNLIMMYKNQGALTSFWKLPLRILLDMIAAMKFMAEGKFSYVSAVFRAVFQFHVWLFFLQRKSIFPASRKPRVGSGYFSGLVIWQYFVRKRTTFSEIIGNK